ncbi:MAG: bleomycin hydrolase [Bacteroidia bacterium]|jgi:bleomycin hydrolase
MKYQGKYMVTAAVFLMSAALNLTNAQIKTLPDGFIEITQCPASSVKNQGKTGTCWSFSTSSFIESEVQKVIGQDIDLSEMFTVRNIYMEKAEKYVRYHGGSNFSQGSLGHDVFASFLKYGAMPEEAYPGKAKDSIHNHRVLEKELKSYLDQMIQAKQIDPHWKAGFAAIIDKHLGEVPAVFKYKGQSYNAKSFAEMLELKPSNYIGITSFTHQPLYQNVVVEVPDNFSDGKYFNTTLDEMMETMNYALKNGYSIEWDGDVSEVGFQARSGYALMTTDTAALMKLPILPPEQMVNAFLRQAAFDNYSTTDDHLMHVVGLVLSEDGRKFYITKNSWSEKMGIEGYVLISEAYMRMKTVCIYVNRKGVPEELYQKM